MREFVYACEDPKRLVHLIEATPEGSHLHVIKGGRGKLASIIKRTRGYMGVWNAPGMGNKTAQDLRRAYGNPQHCSKKLAEELLIELYENYAIQTLGPRKFPEYCEENQGALEPSDKWNTGIVNAFLRQVENEPRIIGMPFQLHNSFSHNYPLHHGRYYLDIVKRFQRVHI